MAFRLVFCKMSKEGYMRSVAGLLCVSEVSYMCVGGPSKKHFDGSPRWIWNAYSVGKRKKKLCFEGHLKCAVRAL